METITQRRRTLATAALLGLTTALLLAPAPAGASRLPADPIVVVSAPVPAQSPSLSPAAGSPHAASVRAALADLKFDEIASPGC